MKYKLNNVNLDFRVLTDLLFFTDRKDLDLKNYNKLLKSNPEHYYYFWDRFYCSSKIHWGSSFWNSRINIILGLNNPKISKELYKTLRANFKNLLRFRDKFEPEYNVEFIQFYEYCKIRKENKKPLNGVKDFLLKMSYQLNQSKSEKVIKCFTPLVFKSFSEYFKIFSKNKNKSFRIIEIMKADSSIDPKVILDLCLNILSSKYILEHHVNVFFHIISNKKVALLLKESDSEYKNNLYKIVHMMNLNNFKNSHFKNIKNLLFIDESLLSTILEKFLDKVYAKYTSHKRAQIDIIVSLIKHVPQVSEKKVLSLLSSRNKMDDINFFLKSFPKLNKLSSFV